MSEPKDKRAKDRGELSESAKKHLIDVFVATRYGRHDDIETSAILKGTKVEEQSMNIYSAYKREFYIKNVELLKNDYIKGTPDIRIKSRKHIVDLKSSWDAFSFYKNIFSSPKSLYRWQVLGYMWLDNAISGSVAYCLVDTPEFLIDIECERLKYKVPASELFEAQALLRKQLVFSDIPYRERIIEQQIERNQADIDKIKGKVLLGRKYLKQIDEHVKNNLLLTELI